ncbi:MAG: mannose/fructose/sorbose family PTS transporter subunit IIC [Bacilli bacterium]
MWQVVAVTLIGGLAGIESVLDQWQWHRPLLACTLVGLALGNLHVGLVIGGELELIALGWMNIGASQSPDTALASVISTTIAIKGGHDIAQAIALGIPIAVAGNLTTVAVRTMTVYFQHRGDRLRVHSSPHTITYLQFMALALQCLRVAIPSFLFAAFVDRAMILHLYHIVPPVLSNGFVAASGFVVVVGYAMVIRSLQATLLMPYFFLGFLVADFTNITLVGVGVAAVCIALLHVRVWNRRDAELPLAPPSAESANLQLRKLPRRVIWITLFRSQFLQASWNYERMQSLGYAYILEPTLDYFYQDETRRHARKVRHLEFYNTNPFVSNVVTGINMALEERLEASGEAYDRLVTSIKLGMMGPLAGVGDSIFWGTLRPLLASVGATLALRGSLLGPVFFFLSFNAVRIASLWGLLEYGYRSGLQIVQVIATGILRQFTEGATVVGLVVMGALVAAWAHVNFAVQWNMGHGRLLTLNHVVDSLLPRLPALLLVFFVLWLLRRGWSSVRVILLLFFMAIIGVWVHLLAP